MPLFFLIGNGVIDLIILPQHSFVYASVKYISQEPEIIFFLAMIYHCECASHSAADIADIIERHLSSYWARPGYALKRYYAQFHGRAGARFTESCPFPTVHEIQTLQPHAEQHAW